MKYIPFEVFHMCPVLLRVFSSLDDVKIKKNERSAKFGSDRL